MKVRRSGSPWPALASNSGFFGSFVIAVLPLVRATRKRRHAASAHFQSDAPDVGIAIDVESLSIISKSHAAKNLIGEKSRIVGREYRAEMLAFGRDDPHSARTRRP